MIEYIAALDAWVLQWLYEARDPSLTAFFIWITQLGGSWLIYAIGICVSLGLILRRKFVYAAGLAISIASSGLFVLFIKGAFERARPDALYQVYLELWYSLPSAHAALATALYGFLAYIAWHMIPNVILRTIVVGFLFLFIVFVSFSRVYLGVHYASDVLAGIVLGMFCVWLGIRWARFAHTP